MTALDPRRRSLALRGILLGLTLGWLVKWQVFVICYVVYRALPLQDAFFPRPLQALPLAVCALCVPFASGLVALVLRTPASAQLALMAYALGSALLLVHQGTFNDATFVSTLWVSAIGVWLHHASRAARGELAARLGFLTQLLFGLLFLGGFVGKLTQGYLDGTTLHDIYFVDRDHFTFSLLRRAAAGADLSTLARGYSWFVLCAELMLASLPLWPTRPALRFAVLGGVSLVLLNNFLLASVIVPIASLALVSLWLLRTEPATTAP